MMKRAAIVFIAAAIALGTLTASQAGAAPGPLRHCRAVRLPGNDAPLRVEHVSCRTATRLVLAWRRRIGAPHEHCIPRNDGFGLCTIDHWRFACQQTPDGHEYPVTAVRGRALFKFAYPV